jgi:uncharacterized protein
MTSMWQGLKDFSGLVIRDELITVHDGTELAVRVYLPAAEGSFPALYAASPYQIDTDTCPASDLFLWYEVGPLEWYVREQGYAMVRLDVRGSGRSGGQWRVLSAAEQRDHCDVIAWIAAQPWSNGKVGGYGQSYYAMSQWIAAGLRPPALACIAPFDGCVDQYRQSFYRGGIPSTFSSSWYDVNVRAQNYARRAGEAPGTLMTYDALADFMVHSTCDEYWQERTPRLADIGIPVLSIGMWGKRSLHLSGNLDGFNAVAGPRWLRVFPGDVYAAHHMFHEIEFHERTLLPFYDHYLKGADNGFAARPPVRVTVTGDAAGDRERTWDAWPPPASPESAYLAPGPTGTVASLNDGALRSRPPAAGNGETAYSYPDPRWRIGSAKLGPAGPDFQVANLTFTSEVLDGAVEVAGYPIAELYLSSDQSDTDVVVTVTDVPPSGTGPAVIVSRGWLRASHRALDEARSSATRRAHPHLDPEPLVPGVTYRLDIELTGCAHVFAAGHRIRFEVSATDSSLNEGPFALHYSWQRVGTDTIHHSLDHPSRVILPVLASQFSRR